jgi:methylated-DNA-[protein]-cysteine S-methyltransferase
MTYARAAAMIATPIGLIGIEVDAETVTGVAIGAEAAELDPDNIVLREACAQLRAYFEARLTRFDLPLSPSLTTRGQALRDAICAIGFGETLSYGEIAAASGSSPRAVGQACARNPLPIIVPCHRVLGAGGALGPYSAGEGSPTKAWLLKHEGAEAWLI